MVCWSERKTALLRSFHSLPAAKEPASRRVIVDTRRQTDTRQIRTDVRNPSSIRRRKHPRESDSFEQRLETRVIAEGVVEWINFHCLNAP